MASSWKQNESADSWKEQSGDHESREGGRPGADPRGQRPRHEEPIHLDKRSIPPATPERRDAATPERIVEQSGNGEAEPPQAEREQTPHARVDGGQKRHQKQPRAYRHPDHRHDQHRGHHQCQADHQVRVASHERIGTEVDVVPAAGEPVGSDARPDEPKQDGLQRRERGLCPASRDEKRTSRFDRQKQPDGRTAEAGERR
ncbi:MAG: hypothetical protein ABEK29_09610 [Bradymonadaceae bacterium]